MSHQSNGFNYYLPNYTRCVQNSQNFYQTQIQLPNEEDRINTILQSTNGAYQCPSIASYSPIHHQSINNPSQLANWYFNSIQTQPVEVTKNLNGSPTSSKQLSIISPQIENSNGLTTSSSHKSTTSLQKSTSSEIETSSKQFMTSKPIENESTTSSNQNSIISTQKPTSSESSNICNKFMESYDIYELREKDLPSIDSIPSNHVPSIDRSETNIIEKDKMEPAKPCHKFYFLIPRYSYKIRHWIKPSKSKSCKQVNEAVISVVDDESLKELDQQQTNNLISVDVDNLCEVLKNFHLDTGSEAEIGKINESFADAEEIGQEIISISSIDNDIDFIIFILKRRKQQKAHSAYELIKLSIIVIRIMTHKQIMCHSIRGRQRGKKKKRFLHSYFQLTMMNIQHQISVQRSSSHHSCC